MWYWAMVSAMVGFGYWAWGPEREASESVITQSIAKISTTREHWTELSKKHLFMTADATETRILENSARRPAIHRLRNMSYFDNQSGFCIPVGGIAEMLEGRI